MSENNVNWPKKLTPDDVILDEKIPTGDIYSEMRKILSSGPCADELYARYAVASRKTQEYS